MTDTTAPASLAAALAQLQTRLPDVHKSQTATVPTKAGGQYKYSYAGLPDISRALLPLLGELGLAWTCRPTLTAEGRFVLLYALLHSSGEQLAGEYPLPAGGSPQEIGSAVTYGRRYCLCSVTGLAADDDDDGAAATAATRTPARRRGSTPARDTAPDEPAEYDPRDPAKIRRHMFALYRNAGIGGDRAERLAFAAAVIGRDITSSDDLNAAECAQVIKALELAVAEPKEEHREP